MQSPTTSPALQPGPCCVPCTHRGSTPSPGGTPKPSLCSRKDTAGETHPPWEGKVEITKTFLEIPNRNPNCSHPSPFPTSTPPLSLHFCFGVAPSAPFQAFPSSLFGSQLGEGG